MNVNIKKQQLKVLMHILKHADRSAFGQFYKIDKWLYSIDLYEVFSTNIPIFDYDSFYKLWIKKAFATKDPIQFNGPLNYVAMTSGTGSLYEKHLPYATGFIREVVRSSMSLIFMLMKLGVSPLHFTKKVLTIGGSTSFEGNYDVITKNHYHPDLTAGFMSGIIFKESPKWFSFMYLPGPEVHALIDWKQKMDIIIEAAPTYNIGTLTGFPSYVLPLLKAIIKRHDLKTIHDIWPDLKLYIHSGVSIEQYRTELLKCFGKKVDFFETYYATEGFFGYSVVLNSDTMHLNIDTNIFYEFVEINDNNITENNEIKKDAIALPLWQVENNKDYALLVSNTSGLFRFVQGDVLTFTNTEKCHFKIRGRISEMINGSGNIVPLSHFTSVFVEFCKVNHIIGISDFFISTKLESGFTTYTWNIISDTLLAENFDELDTYLMEHLILYKSYRNAGITLPCTFNIVFNSRYEKFLFSINKKNGQAKMPKYLRGDLKDRFEQFMANISE